MRVDPNWAFRFFTSLLMGFFHAQRGFRQVIGLICRKIQISPGQPTRVKTGHLVGQYPPDRPRRRSRPRSMLLN